MNVRVEKRATGATVYAPTYVGRVVDLPNGWQAFTREEFVGWSATKRGAVDLVLDPECHPNVRHQHADAARACTRRNDHD